MEEKSHHDFCPNYVQEFGFRTRSKRKNSPYKKMCCSYLVFYLRLTFLSLVWLRLRWKMFQCPAITTKRKMYFFQRPRNPSRSTSGVHCAAVELFWLLQSSIVTTFARRSCCRSSKFISSQLYQKQGKLNAKNTLYMYCLTRWIVVALLFL